MGHAVILWCSSALLAAASCLRSLRPTTATTGRWQSAASWNEPGHSQLRGAPHEWDVHTARRHGVTAGVRERARRGAWRERSASGSAYALAVMAGDTGPPAAVSRSTDAAKIVGFSAAAAPPPPPAASALAAMAARAAAAMAPRFARRLP